MKSRERYMARAIKLAKKAEGMTSPNPIVGAVIVKNGRIVGEGYHKKAGSAHAEVNAIRAAGRSARGASIYVTLEPCNHFGRTPPCTDAIIRSGIKEVIVGMRDPNPINDGAGVKKMRRSGINILFGVLEKECLAINGPYVKLITKKIPYVTLKMAQTLDGKIASPSGDSRWITGEDSRRYVHQMRSRFDAVMVGSNTVMKDDPVLLSKIRGSKQPIRIIVGGTSDMPASLKIFKTAGRSGVIVAHVRREIVKTYPHIQYLACRSKNGRVDLKDMLERLACRGIMNILAEGGGELAWSLIKDGLADKFLFFIAPKIMGGKASLTSVEGQGVNKAADAFRLKNVKVRRFKEDILIEAESK